MRFSEEHKFTKYILTYEMLVNEYWNWFLFYNSCLNKSRNFLIEDIPCVKV